MTTNQKRKLVKQELKYKSSAINSKYNNIRYNSGKKNKILQADNTPSYKTVNLSMSDKNKLAKQLVLKYKIK